MRRLFLGWLYTLFPFDLIGDCSVPPARDDIRISCVINFYGRLELLEGILWSLAQQCYPREKFEVLLVEDQGGTEKGRNLAEEFSSLLPVVYLPLDANYGKMGYSRNFGLAHTRGEIVLFLDDDTVLLQHDFLATLDGLFNTYAEADAVVPHGHAAFSLVADKYDYHDPYFMTSRCTAYRRSVLAELAGFINDFIGQEDVEFVTRFTISGHKAMNTDLIHYYHPPLLVPNLRKPKAVGVSFSRLRLRYPFIIWGLLMLNCARHAPLYILPSRRYKEMGRFGIGFIAGVFVSLFKKNGFQYN
jgi:glycosyltransferase involved in cell wall biosynthesis